MLDMMTRAAMTMTMLLPTLILTLKLTSVAPRSHSCCQRSQPARPPAHSSALPQPPQTPCHPPAWPAHRTREPPSHPATQQRRHPAAAGNQPSAVFDALLRRSTRGAAQPPSTDCVPGGSACSARQLASNSCPGCPGWLRAAVSGCQNLLRPHSLRILAGRLVNRRS